jgi:hypothetical protein
MDPVSVSALVLACLSLVASVITPVVVAGAAFISRIKHSECCGGDIDLADPTPNQPLITPAPITLPSISLPVNKPTN